MRKPYIEKTVYLKIADFYIEINFFPMEYKHIQEKFIKDFLSYYKDYMIKSLDKKNPDAKINVNEGYLLSFISDQKKSLVKLNYSLIFKDYQHSSCLKFETFYFIGLEFFNHILFYCLEKLLYKNDGFFLHGSAIKDNDNRAIIFIGKNGSGKSTIASILEKYFSILADDKLIIRKEGSRFYLYQIPFLEKNLKIKKTSTRFEIKAIFFLNKSKINKIKKVKDFELTFTKFLDQFIFCEHFFLKKRPLLTLFIKFIKSVDFYLLDFNLNNNQQIYQMIKNIK